MKNPLYLKDISLSSAWEIWKTALQKIGMWQVLGYEDIPLDEQAVGRVLYKPVWAKISSPHYHSAAMDGFAIRAESTERARLDDPVILNCDKDQLLPAASYVDTGDPLPGWANAVIPIENVEPINLNGEYALNSHSPECILIRESVPPWSHVRPLGEDIVTSQLVLPSGHELRPVDLGAIAASGNVEIQVAKKPRVAIIPTGTELVPISRIAKIGEIIEFNSMVLAAQVNSWGGQSTRLPIIPDVFEAIRKQVEDASQNFDLILLNAGSSTGSEDYSRSVVEDIGKLLVHGIAIRPGHPVILGIINGTVPIVGVPGYPVSTALTGEIFIEPLLSKWLGKPAIEPLTIEARLTHKLTSPAGDDDYLRVVVGRVGDEVVAAPLQKGSGVISSLVKADGILIIPSGIQGLSAGEKVRINLYCSPHVINRTILAIGSHDIALDLVSEYILKKNRRFVSSNAGSMGGLIALQRKEAHLAGSHLLDPLTGVYNISYVKKYLAEISVKVISFASRQQGFIVQKGNPRHITSLEDLVNPDFRFVNRQRGSGTRVLLDYNLGILGLDKGKIRGYNIEEYSHLAVAAGIAGGRADFGLGIEAAAIALDLDFIPLITELYELVIPKEYYDSDLLQPLLDLLSCRQFQNKVLELPGYDISNMGQLSFETLEYKGEPHVNF